ncbi:MAG: adenylate/guanylate cyclase domain-containing protein [Gammaproteobacteria bacterium]
MPTLSDAPVIVIREPGRTALYLLLVDPIFVGRDGSGVLVDDPQVSRQHLELRPVKGGVEVRDCGGTHGTTIDGVRLSDVTALKAGSLVRLGNTTIELGGCSRKVDVTPEPGAALSSIEKVANSVAKRGSIAITHHSRERTLTIVFTDIELSTEKARALGDTRWFEIISAHNDLIRKALKRYGGTEIQVLGDGFMLTFDSARGAIDALIEIQQHLHAAHANDNLSQIKIRAGAHVGEAIALEGGELLGIHVNTAARVAAQATGGEILVSPIVREIIEARGDLRFGVPRTVSLKGIDTGYVVHPVEWKD